MPEDKLHTMWFHTGEDVLKIYTLNYEFSDSAVREANPPVNSGDLSSVDGPGGWWRAPLYCTLRVEGPLS